MCIRDRNDPGTKKIYLERNIFWRLQKLTDPTPWYVSVDLSTFVTEIRIYERSRNHVDEYMYLSVVTMLKRNSSLSIVIEYIFVMYFWISNSLCVAYIVPVLKVETASYFVSLSRKCLYSFACSSGISRASSQSSLIWSFICITYSHSQTRHSVKLYHA